MNRHLLLISNPGNPSDKNYIKTTEDAIDRWELFFKSPIGGFWKDEEITRFGEDNPICPEGFKRMMIPLNMPAQCDYSIVVFCGHGGCTIDGYDAIQLPVPNETNNQLLAVNELTGKGMSGIRRTIILDACRSLIPYTSAQLFESKDYPVIFKTNGDLCREYYDSLVTQAQPHVEILYSTSEHHAAYGAMDGSQYADSMSNLVRRKASLWKDLAINDPNGQFCYTMNDLHNDLTNDLKGRGIQVPDYRITIGTRARFPFVAIRLKSDLVSD